MAKKDKKKRSVLAGTLQKHKNGFGFVDAGGEEDIFIPPDGMNGAMDGDVVEIDLLPPYMWDRRPEAIVTRVRERAVSEVIGTFYRRKNYGFVVPEGGRSRIEHVRLPAAVLAVFLLGRHRFAAFAAGEIPDRLRYVRTFCADQLSVRLHRSVTDRASPGEKQVCHRRRRLQISHVFSP